MTTNVLYITVDAMRADRVGFPDGDGDTTPVLDGVAATGTVYERAIANGIPTYYSFKSLLGGIHSLSHRREIGLPPTATSLPELFREAGYTTAAFNAKNPWLTAAYGYDRGFDAYRDFMGGSDSTLAFGQLTRLVKRIAKRTVSFSDALTDKLGRYGRIGTALAGSQPIETAGPVTKAAIDWLRSVPDGQPFFLWIHYMDPHYPWIPPNEHLDGDVPDDLSRFEIGSIWHTVAHEYRKESATVTDRTLDRIKRLYDAELGRTDAAIGRLFDALRAEDAFDTTVKTVVGDHGTELYDHGGFSHGPRTLYDEVLRVPLLFHGPGVPETTGGLAALVDIPQTLVGLTSSIEEPPSTYEGVDLFDESREAAVSEVVYDFDPVHDRNATNGLLQAVTAPPWKLIRNQHTDTDELYNVEEDSGEREPITDEPDVKSRLESTLGTHRSESDRRNRTIAEKARIRRRVARLKRTGEI